ncbi:glycosyltransferase [Desulfobulbus rhabdoformis]|uniref:glycosyltransferase n=1 Tax=Desulfobulbus rhabdoformis TaxID=34032 RepID=UPI001964EF6A|nr:glycosyltransferase [Desulfobulbus rhabdoformis]MBM9616843.1 glycosyltransferase [Desulfobulbus rhabdoformis]
MKKKIWFTWEYQRRNKSLSKEVDAELFEIVTKKKYIARYIISSYNTVKIVRKEKPDILFCQNPSIMLSFLCLFLRKIYKFKVVVDEHYAGLYPLEGKFFILNSIAKYISIKSDYVIVTTKKLCDEVKLWGGTPFILEDPIPLFDEPINDIVMPSTYNVLYICSWSKDEPFDEAINAFSEMKFMNFYISGKYSNKIKTKNICKNINLTGYVSEKEYISLLKNVDLVIVLTRREECLNCGAYEALSFEKPMILSNTKAIRDYFNNGVVYTDNDRDSIKKSLINAFDHQDVLKKDIAVLKKRLDDEWKFKKTKVLNTIEAS